MIKTCMRWKTEILGHPAIYEVVDGSACYFVSEEVMLAFHNMLFRFPQNKLPDDIGPIFVHNVRVLLEED